jgi:hypothetical protein
MFTAGMICFFNIFEKSDISGGSIDGVIVSIPIVFEPKTDSGIIEPLDFDRARAPHRHSFVGFIDRN